MKRRRLLLRCILLTVCWIFLCPDSLYESCINPHQQGVATGHVAAYEDVALSLIRPTALPHSM